jgi:hypothetical protein
MRESYTTVTIARQRRKQFRSRVQFMAGSPYRFLNGAVRLSLVALACVSAIGSQVAWAMESNLLKWRNGSPHIQSGAVDSAGNLFLADAGRGVILKVAPDGTTTRVAGTGVPGFSGDDGPATQAQIVRSFRLTASQERL